MTSPLKPGNLSTQEWDLLHDCANRFEDAWAQGEIPELDHFLPEGAAQLRLLVLVELIKIDLEFRWRQGKSTLIESYLHKFADLAEDTTVIPGLLAEEFRVRSQFGDKPTLGQFQRRFPRSFDEFKTLVDSKPDDTAGEVKGSDTRDIEGATLKPAPRAKPPSELQGSDSAGSRPATRKEPPKPTQAMEGAGSHREPGQRAAGGRREPEPPPAPAKDAPGKEKKNVVLLGGSPYPLKKFLGRGQFGEVWLAEAPGGIDVAVKIIFRSLEHAESQRELDSLELTKNLHHPFLVKTQAYDQLEDRLYIAMELADQSLGGRLKECLQITGKPLMIAELLPYMREAGEALDFLHSQGVLHRDIKPDNIMLVRPAKSKTGSQRFDTLQTMRAHVKVADFGLARMLQDHMQTASIAGAPAYMAPEIWRGKITAQSDQYALAVTYVQLRLNRLPFKGSNLANLMSAHLESNPELEGLEEKEAKVIRQALDKDPDKRFSTCTALVEALEKALLKQPPAGAPAAPVPINWKKLGLFTAVLAFIVGGGAWGVLTYLQESEFELVGMDHPVPFRAGETKPVSFRLARKNFRGPVSIHFDGMPEHVSLGKADVATGADLIKFEIKSTFRANVGPEDKTWPIKVRAEGGGMRRDETLKLVVKPAHLVLPPLPEGTKIDIPAEASVHHDAAGIPYLDRIDLLKGPARVRFLLIAKRESDTENIATFYIMQHRVNVGLYRQFAEKAEPPLTDETWKEAKYAGPNYPQDNLPVFGVGVLEALQFAKWLGGPRANLPTTKQWDKAAGRFEPFRRDGPYKAPDGGTLGPDDVAINRTKLGPMPCGQALLDESLFGCRDMAGNGWEWTRNIARKNGTVPLALPTSLDQVELRGKSYRYTAPLQFSELDRWDKLENLPFSRDYTKRSNDVSFRVVLEP